MDYMNYVYLLLDRDFMVVALSGVATFATIITLGMPYLKGDPLESRMKAVAERREELRRKAHEAMVQANRRGQLRTTPVGFMKRTVDNLNIQKLAESPGMKEKLARAGFRGQGPVVAFMFFRFVMPPVLFLGALIYLFGIRSCWPLSGRRSWATTVRTCMSAIASSPGAIPSCGPFPMRST
jgi:tight adherence protein C